MCEYFGHVSVLRFFDNSKFASRKNTNYDYVYVASEGINKTYRCNVFKYFDSWFIVIIHTKIRKQYIGHTNLNKKKKYGIEDNSMLMYYSERKILSENLIQKKKEKIQVVKLFSKM